MRLLRSRHDDQPAATPAHGDVVLSGRGLGARYGRSWVLQTVDIDVLAGEVVALVGPNGAGKSTLLALLAGDLAPAAGEVRLAGQPLVSIGPRALSRHRAVLPQQHVIAFPFSVDEVVRMGFAPWIGTEQEADEDAAVARAMQRADIEDLRWREVTSLSGGEHARVAVARVLAQGTAVRLLDEPTAALDLKHQELVMKIAREDAAEGAAVIVVLHDLALAAAHADRVALLDRGRLRSIGSPHAVMRPELLSDVYGQPVEVLDHPRTGELIVLPVRSRRSAAHGCGPGGRRTSRAAPPPTSPARPRWG